jgi:sacsin
LQLANCLGTVDIIETYIIPAWKSGKASSWAYSCKENIAILLLGQYSCLSLQSQEALKTLPMVPVVRIDGRPTSKFAIAAELIDPSVPDLKTLFFDDEEALPTKDFFGQFGMALKGCGLKTAVDEDLVNRRIHCYASSNRELSKVQQCAHRLLESPCHWNSQVKSSELQQLEWLPIVGLEGDLGLKSPKQCRGSGDRLLVGFQLPIFEFPISVGWETRLGWRDRLPTRILLAQLNQGLRRNDRAVVDAVLTYIDCHGQTEQLADELLKLPCILTSKGIFVTPSKAFRPTTTTLTPGCEHLHPYLGNVDNKFWQDHEKLLTTLNIGKGPSLKDLLSVQKILESKKGLDEADIVVAIEILKVASHFPRASLADLKVLGDSGNFYSIQDINYDDLGILTPVEKGNLTHPDIPLRIIKELGIEKLSERLLKGLLEIADIDDEDEFDQREQVTSRIVDTLDRYPVNTTFGEYLANADDTEGASEISWLLDERDHPCKLLLTPELMNFQGPALLVHNDGGKCSSRVFFFHRANGFPLVFSEDDFKGFKNVGEGSKRDDQGTIGQFGRGSQTMYHWTDVPMILSGRFLLILE